MGGNHQKLRETDVDNSVRTLFFFSQELLYEYSKKNSESAEEGVPSSNYFLKILTFWDIHYKRANYSWNIKRLPA